MNPLTRATILPWVGSLRDALKAHKAAPEGPLLEVVACSLAQCILTTTVHAPSTCSPTAQSLFFKHEATWKIGNICNRMLFWLLGTCNCASSSFRSKFLFCASFLRKPKHNIQLASSKHYRLMHLHLRLRWTPSTWGCLRTGGHTGRT